MDRRGLATPPASGSLEELTSRIGSDRHPADPRPAGGRLRPGGDEQRERPSARDARRPLDVLLATNMISVGVDVQRLGLMVVAGQPKTTAEYIQATSRVGRAHPGLVCTVFNWARPRDLSHYESFEHYHATFYQHVEALSVTPFSPRALDRGLTALLVSLVRLPGSEFNPNRAAAAIDRDHAFVRRPSSDRPARRAGRPAARTPARRCGRSLRRRLDRWLHGRSGPRGSPGSATGRSRRRDAAGCCDRRAWGVGRVHLPELAARRRADRGPRPRRPPRASPWPTVRTGRPP